MKEQLLSKMIIEIIEEIGAYNLGQVMGILKSNNVSTVDMLQLLRKIQ